MPSAALPRYDALNSLTGPLSVLILDDERFDRHRMARLCSGLPVACSITNATTLEGFCDKLGEDAFHLILVDYVLPDGTGLDALDAVRCSSLNFGAATMMITGHSDDTVAQAALRAGCAAYLTKDALTTHTFLRAITDALDRAALRVGVESHSFDREDVEKILENFAGHFSADLKPIVSRSLRLVRDLRAAPTPERITAVEQSCIALWETIVAGERHKGSDLMAQMITHRTAPLNAVRKPPSPFSRMQH